MNILLAYIQFVFIGFIIYGSVVTFSDTSINTSLSGIFAPILAWFSGTGLRASFNGDNKTDLTEDYSLERNYIKTKDNINGTRNFITSALIENKNIQTIKIDKVEINELTRNILWRHDFNRIDITNDKVELIYAFRKIFTGNCKKEGEP